jgi:hypothetical protein
MSNVHGYARTLIGMTANFEGGRMSWPADIESWGSLALGFFIAYMVYFITRFAAGEFSAAGLISVVGGIRLGSLLDSWSTKSSTSSGPDRSRH